MLLEVHDDGGGIGGALAVAGEGEDLCDIFAHVGHLPVVLWKEVVVGTVESATTSVNGEGVHGEGAGGALVNCYGHEGRQFPDKEVRDNFVHVLGGLDRVDQRKRVVELRDSSLIDCRFIHA